MPKPEPPKRPPPLPTIRAEVDKTVGIAADQQRRFDAPRRKTLTGMPAQPGPGEQRPPVPVPTVPAENPLRKATWRIPTPPSALAAARRSDPPTADGIWTPLVAPARQLGSSDEMADFRAQWAEFQRQQRVQAEAASPNTYPPKVTERKPSPPPSSIPAKEEKLDRAIGQTIRLVLERYGWKAIAVSAIAAVVLKPTADPEKTNATLVNVEATHAELTVISKQLAGVLKREATRDAYIRCVDEGVNEIGSQLLPAVDRQGAAVPLRAWVDKCQRLRP